jgi:uncharacterized membrane-anchored protein YitT (DUF2179 family)
MPASTMSTSKAILHQVFLYFWMAIGAFLAAFAIDVFLIPNHLIDGGVVGVAMICGNVFGRQYLPYFVVAFNLPFIYLAYRYIGKTFLVHMLVAVLMFVGSLAFIGNFPWEFKGDILEIVIIGGALLGIGIGLIIRVGGCLDGTEILGIIINRQTGFTVGQVVLVCNIFIFGAFGLILKDWHPPLLSLITYLVVHKVMDAVIVGLDETKSITIISKNSKQIAEAIMHELGLGLTIMYGRGGFSGDEREILYVIAERLQLADIKDIIFREDPTAFMAIENLHEVANGKQGAQNHNKKTRITKVFSQIFGK